MKKVLRITSKRDGFMRGGHAHPAQPTDYALDFFTEEQLKAISEEPMLSVREVDAEAAAVVVTGSVADPVMPKASGLLLIRLSEEDGLSLTEIVQRGLHESKLSVEEWNRLTEQQRAAFLQEEMDTHVGDALGKIRDTVAQQVAELTERLETDKTAAVAEALEKAKAEHDEAMTMALEKAEADKVAAVADAVKKAGDNKKTEAAKPASRK